MSPNYNYSKFIANKKKEVKRSLKDLSHEWKHDISVGELVPCLRIHTLPGDDFRIRSQFFFKFEPLYFPLIHRMSLDVDYFWVRNGAMWPTQYDGSPTNEGWENFIMMKGSGGHPTIDWASQLQSTGTLNNSVMGYFGLPYTSTAGGSRELEITGLNAFPAMAYLMIYDQYYRHPQVEDPVALFRLTDGDNTANMNSMYLALSAEVGGGVTNRYTVGQAKWAKDLITSTLPTPQIGDPVLIPSTTSPASPSILKDLDGNPVGGGQVETLAGGEFTGDGVNPAYVENSATIRDFSLMSVLQTLREQLMKVGQIYKNWIDWSHDVDVDPLMLNQPIMIGSYRGTVQISDVFTQANTTVEESNFYSGNYTGNASLYETMPTINFHCRDYGILMAIMSLTPNPGYGQGIGREWRYSDPLDYPMDIFQTVGDQEMLREEVFYENRTANLAFNQETFGYGVRYYEAMGIPNNYGSNLLQGIGLSVHLGKYYDPTMNITDLENAIQISKQFLSAGQNVTNGGGSRVADTFRSLVTPHGYVSQKPVWAYVLHEIEAMRPLAAYSTPGLV